MVKEEKTYEFYCPEGKEEELAEFTKRKIIPEDGIYILTKEKAIAPMDEGVLLPTPNTKAIWKRKAEMEAKNNETQSEAQPLQKKIWQLLLQKDVDQATERIFDAFLEKNFVYTTRHDDKSEMWIYNNGIYVPHGKSFIKQFCREILGIAYTEKLTNRVIAKIEADTYIDQKQFFSNNIIEKIAVENGLLNIFTRELEDFDPKQIFFNKHPVTYNPQSECSSIKKHFEAITKHEDDPLLLQEIIGYCLLKKHHIEKAFMFNGSGRNGKSKTEELIKKFLGEENCSNISLDRLENDNFSTSELFGKLANLSGDITGGIINDSSTFKQITGGDSISARRKFLTDIYFQSYTKQIYCCNELPKSKDDSFAFWNRWILLEFPHTFLSSEELEKITEDEKEELKKHEGGKYKLADKELIMKITTPEELSGLLNLALDGLDRLMKNKNFTYSKSTEQVKEKWIRKSDNFSAFLTDCVQENYSGKVSKQELKEKYSKYCNKYKLKMVSDVEIAKTITSKLAVTTSRIMEEGNSKNVWNGILLKGDVLCK